MALPDPTSPGRSDAGNSSIARSDASPSPRTGSDDCQHTESHALAMTTILPSPIVGDRPSEDELRPQTELDRSDEAKSKTGFPDRLRHSDSDDEQSSPAAITVPPPPISFNMDQSIFGLIAAAGSKVDFNECFDDASSDEDYELDDSGMDDNVLKKNSDELTHDMSQSMILDPSLSNDYSPRRGFKKRITGHRLFKSISSMPNQGRRSSLLKSRIASPALNLASHHELDESLMRSRIHCLEEQEGRQMPVMSRMLLARAEMAGRPSSDLDDHACDARTANSKEEFSPLAKRLMEIFDFCEPEKVIEEYPCWLLQSVLLQGFLYITSKHLCFYAYLPKQANVVAKSGFLSKSGKRNPTYTRYWFRLQGDVLSYYRDATDLYFPHGQIDLRFGISASLVNKKKSGVQFTIVTSHRTYNFKADSAPSANEWVESLQRVIFRSHNDGDSVKISLPIDNIIDVEDAQMMEFSDTCKIRVIDNDETYAIDEYFFSFFSFGQEAINILKILVEDASVARHSSGRASAVSHNTISPTQKSFAEADSAIRTSSSADLPRPMTVIEPVRATLSPFPLRSPSPSPHASCDVSTRTSFDVNQQASRRSHEAPSRRKRSPRRSFGSHTRSNTRELADQDLTQSVADLSDIHVEIPTDRIDAHYPTTEPQKDTSMSQILQGSEVFHRPSLLQMSSSAAQGRGPDPTTDSGQTILDRKAKKDYQRAASLPIVEKEERPTTPTLQNIARMGSYPLQRAGAFADYLNKTSKRVSSMLAIESLGYVEKVSGMWKGERKHYDEPSGIRPDEDELEEDAEGKIRASMERFRAHFALPESERLQATYFGSILRVLPLYGKIYVSDRSFCFRSLLPGTRTKLILPLKNIETAHKEKGFRFGYYGLVIVICGHEELFFEFGQAEVRDYCAVTLLQALEVSRSSRASEFGRLKENQEAELALAELDALKLAGRDEFPEHVRHIPQQTSCVPDVPLTLSNETDGSFLNFKPPSPLRITCLTIGSRGDVQPYISLCKGLLAEGHKPRIATHIEFKEWIESHSIEFACVEGDPGELMRLCIENGTFTFSFLREANATFRGWLDELLDSAYLACKGSDLLIESPSAMAGIHIAEKLGIPYFRAFTMPWTRTRAYPHAFIMPERKMGGAYNYMTYVMFDNIFWKATANQVNRWRNKTLGLPNTGLEKMQPNKVPFLYNFSRSVVAPPLDFSNWIRVTGYWFLDEGSDYEPPESLANFIKQARLDGKKLVYVGFGSIIVNDPAKMTQEVIDAILKSDVRCILSKGWSDRISAKDNLSRPRLSEPDLPAEIFVIKSAPHDWLFRQIDAAAHHGGSGTTGASLRAGIPTIIRPFFGDQYFFASRVEDLGVGIWIKRWGTNSFGRALWEATRNECMIIKARLLGEQIRREQGVDNAIQSIYRDLDYATSLIKGKSDRNEYMDATDSSNETEESWTFINAEEPHIDAYSKNAIEGSGLVGRCNETTLGRPTAKGKA